MERGEFDDLPGEGKPLNLDDRDPNWWVKGLLEREQIRMPLPTSLQLRREAKEIDETVADCRDEAGVRDLVDELNERILDSHRRRVDGPPVVTAKVDADAVVERWRERRAARRTRLQVDEVHPGTDAPADPDGDAEVMASPMHPRRTPALLRRPLAVGLRLLLWPLLIEVAASSAARSQDDALGAGLLAFVVIVVLAFGLALLDGLVLTARPLLLVWSVVTVVVSVLVSFQPTIDGLVDGDGRGALAGSFRVDAADLPSSLLFLLVLVSVPAVLGAVSGAAVRRSTGGARAERAGSALT